VACHALVYRGAHRAPAHLLLRLLHTMAGDELVEGFRKSLEEDDICMMADAAVAMEEEFLLDIISDIDPTASVYIPNNRRKSTRQMAQRKRPQELQADVQKIQEEVTGAHRGEIMEQCPSPGSSMSELDTSSCASSTNSGESSSEWMTVPMVTPEQMFALGRMVKEQRSCSSVSSFSSADAPAGG